MALETNAEAYIPVYLSLIKLQLKSLWHSLTGGTDKELTLWTDDGTDHWYLGKARDDFKRRWRGRKGDDRSQGTSQLDGGSNGEGMQGHDPIEWMQKKKQEDLDRMRADEDAERGYGRDDYFGGGAGDIPGLRMDEVDDELLETMLLVALCGMIAGLVYLRRRVVERRAAEDEELRRQAAGRAPQVEGDREVPQRGPQWL